MEALTSGAVWGALGAIIVANILLSGDNAVVIAMAARSLPPQQQRKAIIYGSAAAIVMRIVLTIVAVQMLQVPYLKIAGALISGGADTADAKLAVMEECGFTVTRNPSEMGKLLKEKLR